MLKEIINDAIKASTLVVGQPVDNMAWRDLAKKAYSIAEEEDSEIADLLWAISKLHGNGNSLTMNANSLLRVAKRMLL